MISPATDYRPIDKRPVRWSSAMEPLSMQKRGLVHWIPCGRLDVGTRRLADRRFRPATEVPIPLAWFAGPSEASDSYRGTYGVFVGGVAPTLFPAQRPADLLDTPSLLAGTPNFIPLVTAAPLTITYWTRHVSPGWATPGVEVYLGATSGGWHAFWTSLSSTFFEAMHAENAVFESAKVFLPVSLNEWHFCAAVFVSNSDRWAYCDGLAGAHNTNALTPTATKSILRIGSLDSSTAQTSDAIGSSLRDIRVYDRALEESELSEMYRNPYDMWAQYDRDDDFQFFTTSEPVEGIAPPVLSVGVSLHAPSIVTPLFIEPAAQTIATALHAPSILADLGFQVSALTVSVTAHTPASVNLEEEVIQEDERELEPHNFKVRIVDYVGGDDLRISRTYTELPEGIIISKGYLTIKRYAKDDADAEAILQKQITSSEGVAGQITDATTTGGSIELHFDLTGAETGTLTPLVAYHYDVQIISQAGAIYTCEKGVIVMQQGITDATS